MKMVGYLSLGYPTLERSLEMADVYIEGGCNAVEISIPSPNPCYEKETIKTWMQEAYAAEADYEVYFNAIEGIKKRHPDREVYTMVYQEVFDMVTPQRYADFCVQAGVDCVISANLTKESIDALDEKAVSRCSFGSFILDPKRLNNCLKPGGLIYMQTKPFPGQTALPGYETLGDVIQYMHDLGITRPIYCGGGIQSPADVKGVKEAGADGFFVGTAMISLAKDLDKLRREIYEYKAAAAD
ncbi:Tryptophan synthase alpha chain [[Eubacterium] contortum]|uniref:tryptophan synthase n=2 Tax=Faecalicatena contorta TaxID=39482 RepID=A0A174A4N8_9FIRM|nr:Tryptophan synthase alpha chain [[Eubacterium] contortum] [Faecalicatena contorta]